MLIWNNATKLPVDKLERYVARLIYLDFVQLYSDRLANLSNCTPAFLATSSSCPNFHVDCSFST